MCKEYQLTEAEKHANAAFLVVKWLCDRPMIVPRDIVVGDALSSKLVISSLNGSHKAPEMNADGNALALEDIDIQIELARLGLLEIGNAINASCADAQMYLSVLQSDIQKAVSLYKEMVQDFVHDIREMRNNFVEFKANHRGVNIPPLLIPSSGIARFPKHENQLHQIRYELAETNDRLNFIRAWINTTIDMYGCPVRAENLVEIDGWSADCSTSNLSAVSIAPENSSDKSSFSCCYGCPGKITEQTLDQEFEGGSTFSSDNQESEQSVRLVKNLSHNQTAPLWLREEFKMIYDAFITLNVQLAAVFSGKEFEKCSDTGTYFPGSLAFVSGIEHSVPHNGFDQLVAREVSQIIRPSKLQRKEAEASCHSKRQLIADGKINHASSFFSKLEETCATMKEADYMLNALLKANQNAKQLTCLWKKGSQELEEEKASLIEEIKQLNSLILLRERETEILQNQTRHSLEEIAKAMSLLEESFLHMQRDVEEMCEVVFSDALAIVQEMLHCTGNSRLSLEDICSKTMENGITSLVLQQCLVDKLFQKFRCLSIDSRLKEGYKISNNLRKRYLVAEDDTMVNAVKSTEDVNQTAVVTGLDVGELGLAHDSHLNENLNLKKELERKEVLLKGLLFDFSLLQESASSTKDNKDEIDKLISTLSEVRQELRMKTSQLDDILIQHRALAGRLTETENALFISDSDLEKAKATLDIFSDHNDELRILLEDLYVQKSETEEQLEEQREAVRSLEKEILRMTSSAERQLITSTKHIEDDFRKVTGERDQLLGLVDSLQQQLDMAYTLANENEAVAIEARQESEASKIFAEQKEGEVKILERSVEELDCTINVLEKR
ncbi:unnamed protein product [Ilex paraguariensis]|uniref:Uncharacterized protein n=1 Tax=Ilex paraguariensis TaxID=185542 RepID=A0ABC8UP66_9AQUA